MKLSLLFIKVAVVRDMVEVQFERFAFQAKMSVSAGRIETVNPERSLKKQQDEEKRLAEMMIPKKKKYLYDKIMFGKKRKTKEVICQGC